MTPNHPEIPDSSPTPPAASDLERAREIASRNPLICGPCGGPLLQPKDCPHHNNGARPCCVPSTEDLAGDIASAIATIRAEAKAEGEAAREEAAHDAYCVGQSVGYTRGNADGWEDGLKRAVEHLNYRAKEFRSEGMASAMFNGPLIASALEEIAGTIASLAANRTSPTDRSE